VLPARAGNISAEVSFHLLSQPGNGINDLQLALGLGDHLQSLSPGGILSTKNTLYRQPCGLNRTWRCGGRVCVSSLRDFTLQTKTKSHSLTGTSVPWEQRAADLKLSLSWNLWAAGHIGAQLGGKEGL
jgi:hypothetical protein